MTFSIRFSDRSFIWKFYSLASFTVTSSNQHTYLNQDFTLQTSFFATMLVKALSIALLFASAVAGAPAPKSVRDDLQPWELQRLYTHSPSGRPGNDPHSTVRLTSLQILISSPSPSPSNIHPSLTPQTAQRHHLRPQHHTHPPNSHRNRSLPTLNRKLLRTMVDKRRRPMGH